MRKLKKLIYFTLISALLFPLTAQARKMSSIVICAETGKIHAASDPDAKIPPSSLTKMMTLYLAFQALRDGKLTMKQQLPVSKHAARQEPCKLWLRSGTTISVRQAILGMITKSANDAAVAMAEALGQGSEKTFALKMMKCAHKLGMKNTVFKNASGLPNKHQITTARDMAILSRALYQHFPEYFKLFSTREFRYGKDVHHNHNKLLGKVKGVDGIKTGFTCASGFNLAASVVRNNRRIIAVVLGGETRHVRDKKMVGLLEAAYSQFPKKSRRSPSIGGLIHAHTLSTNRPMRRASKQTPNVQVMKANYQSLDALFHDLQQ